MLRLNCSRINGLHHRFQPHSLPSQSGSLSRFITFLFVYRLSGYGACPCHSIILHGTHMRSFVQRSSSYALAASQAAFFCVPVGFERNLCKACYTADRHTNRSLVVWRTTPAITCSPSSPGTPCPYRRASCAGPSRWLACAGVRSGAPPPPPEQGTRACLPNLSQAAICNNSVTHL